MGDTRFSLRLAMVFSLLITGAVHAISVRVSDAEAEPGTEGVSIAIEADGAAGIAGGDLTLSYDAAALTATGVAAGDLLANSGIMLIPNLATVGEVRIVLAGTSGISSNSGALITVTFEVNADAAPGGYELTLTQAVFYDQQAQELPLQSNTPGTFTVNGNTAIENHSWGQLKASFGE